MEELIKVVIADDEKIIREGMQNYIPWEKEGMKLIASVRNGGEALEIFEHENIDLLITDIRMPILNGMELLEVLEKDYPNVSVIFISAYGDFKYTKKAIKSRIVYDYLLKPFEFDEIIQLLREVISYIKLQKLSVNNVLLESNLIVTNSYEKYSPLMQNCLQLIDKLYNREDLSLTYMAKELGISANYLSSYFKNEMGIGFVKYLNEKRVEVGKELLQDIRFKTYEIANRVGIEDSRYFSRLFKEITGMTPSEYRNDIYCKGNDNK